MNAGSVTTLKNPAEVKKLRASASDRTTLATFGKFLELRHDELAGAVLKVGKKTPIPISASPTTAAAHLPHSGTLGIVTSLAVIPPPMTATNRKTRPAISSSTCGVGILI
jgi:hypothetical protein